MKYFTIISTIALSLLSCASFQAMENAKDLNNNNDSITSLSTSKHASDIKPFFTKKITVIPQYVYENANQFKKFDWKPEAFATIKKWSPKATHSAIVNSIIKEAAKKNKAPTPQQTLESKEYTEKAEVYDWVHALNYLEETYIKPNKDFVPALSPNQIANINGKISRLTNENANKLRQRAIRWDRYPFGPEEVILYNYIDNTHQQMNTTGENPYQLIWNTTTQDINTQGVVNLLKTYKKNKRIMIPQKDGIHNQPACIVFFDQETGKPLPVDFEKINPKEIADNWQKQYPGTTAETFNFTKWMQDRTYFFPEPETITKKINDALPKISGHPIEQAARIWLETIRIHVGDEANKRTGKALASIILLQNGYLPPLIVGQDGERYTELLVKNIDNGEAGFEHFLQFVIEMIEKTQKQFEGKLN